MKQILYTTKNLSDLSINSCHLGMCSKQQRNRCLKERECLMGLTGSDERKIANIRNHWLPLKEKEQNKVYKKVEEWRKAMLKKCKPFLFSIERAKGMED